MSRNREGVGKVSPHPPFFVSSSRKDKKDDLGARKEILLMDFVGKEKGSRKKGNAGPPLSGLRHHPKACTKRVGANDKVGKAGQEWEKRGHKGLT